MTASTSSAKCPFSWDQISAYYARVGLLSRTAIVAGNYSAQNLWDSLPESEQSECTGWIKNHFAKTYLAQ